MDNYTKHSMLGANGKVEDGFDGKNAWIKFNGQLSDDEQANGVARFLRKTNYYWFAMFFKLQVWDCFSCHSMEKKLELAAFEAGKEIFSPCGNCGGTLEAHSFLPDSLFFPEDLFPWWKWRN